MPDCDISEQISTASKEASGTGNMKFMMNGALTLGTMDGANVEIAELVGEDNIFIFGLTSDEVNKYKNENSYNARAIYDNDSDLREVIDQLTNGFFENVREDEFAEIRAKLLNKDRYFVLEDFDGYRKAHERANDYYKNPEKWYESCIINIAKSGYFSSDRTIKQYVKDIWKIKPMK